MYKSQRSYIAPETKMVDLIEENHSLLLFLQHFDVDLPVGNKTVGELCGEYNINLQAFLGIGNLYNGFYPTDRNMIDAGSISSVLLFLKNSHHLYKENIYPELELYLHRIKDEETSKDFQLIAKFFDDYISEVWEHFKYEDEIAFPYFNMLLNGGSGANVSTFSVKDYRSHHTDIETKLTDLKNLLLKHIKVKQDFNIKRKFLISLFELEFELMIHSDIEENILIPLIEKIEEANNG